MNNNHNIIIIGCGAGGGTAAQFARKTDRKANITIFEKGPYPQYSKCGIPYAISGKISNFSDLIEFSEEWFKKSNIDLFLNTTVKEINVKKKLIIAKNDSNIIEKPYDSLIIATGAIPIIPKIENIFENGKLIDGISSIRTIQDGKKIQYYKRNANKIMIIGGGLIGIEIADNLYEKGINLTVVEALPNIFSNTLDPDLSESIKEKLSGKIKIFTNHLATRIKTQNGKIKSVYIKDNDSDETREIDTDLIIIAIGNKPDSKIVLKTGCKINDKGFISINEKSETSIRNIYAVGDCTEYKDYITKKSITIGLGSITVRQAIAAGINAAGGDYRLPNGFLQTCTTSIFGIEIATVGPLNLDDISYVTGKFEGSSLPDYYPGGKPITIKVKVEEKTGKIIAAQAIGDKAAQRINTLACAILGEMDVETFTKLETAYAPPIAPTLDTITIACDIASIKLKRKKRLK